MQSFTRTVYDNGYKYTMVYPPGWRSGDPRRPLVYKEPCILGPSDLRIAGNSFLGVWPYPDRQPRTAATATSHQPAGSSTVVQHAQQTAWSHPLGAYLAQTWLPQYTINTQVDLSAQYEWPFFQALVRVPRTRKLYLVQRIFAWDLYHALALFKEAMGNTSLTSTLAEQGKLADLTLPDTSICVMDEHDAEFLDTCRPNAPSDITRLLRAYPLRTAIKATKLFLGIPDGHQLCPILQFNDVNHLCPVQHTDLFDLIAMPGSQPDELSLLILVARPWDFRHADFEEFARVGVPDADIDLIHSTTPYPFPSDTLWAVIWDICFKHNCRFFVLTTYDEWVFGTLSIDMHRARVTSPLCAPVFPGTMSVTDRDICQPCFPVPNVVESLVLWVLAAQDNDHFWWPLPPDLPEPADSRELSVLDGGWADLGIGPQF